MTKKLKLLHREYTVRLLPADDERLSDNWGKVRPSDEIIHIADRGTIGDKIDTFIHEIIEALGLDLRLWGDMSRQDAEALVVRLTGGLLSVIRINFPEIWDILERYVGELEVEKDQRYE